MQDLLYATPVKGAFDPPQEVVTYRLRTTDLTILRRMNQLKNGPRDTKAEESERLTYKDCVKKKMEIAAPLHLHTVVNDEIRQQDHSYVTPVTARTRLAASRSGSDPEKSPAHVPPRVEYSMEKHFSRG